MLPTKGLLTRTHEIDRVASIFIFQKQHRPWISSSSFFFFFITFLGIFIFEKLIARCSTTIPAINLHRSLTFIQTGGTQGLGRASGVPFSKQRRRDGVDERLERNLSVSFRFGLETFMKRGWWRLCPLCRLRIEERRSIIRFFTFDHLKHTSTRFSRPNSESNLFSFFFSNYIVRLLHIFTTFCMVCLFFRFLRYFRGRRGMIG